MRERQCMQDEEAAKKNASQDETTAAKCDLFLLLVFYVSQHSSHKQKHQKHCSCVSISFFFCFFLSHFSIQMDSI